MSIKRAWLNQHPEASLNKFELVESFLIQHGTELTTLNLKGFENLEDEQLERIAKYTPNLHHIAIISAKISDKAFEHLKGMPLTKAKFMMCRKLTDYALHKLFSLFLFIIQKFSVKHKS